MEIRADFQLKSVIKALKDNVIPAVDPNHKMAVEQAQLAVHVLQVLADKLPMQYRYDRHELNQYVALAERLETQVCGGAKTTEALADLKKLMAPGRDTLDRARAEPSELEQALLNLRAKVGDLVAAALEDGDETSRKHLEKEIMASAREQLTRERSWLIPMGFEPDPAALTPVEQLLDPVK
ncbi:MAG: hypothetical protein M0Q95_09130 [Porticoccaceae bacterium]|nr:hypothetical protein [Porticoccaceae bacterium]